MVSQHHFVYFEATCVHDFSCLFACRIFVSFPLLCLLYMLLLTPVLPRKIVDILSYQKAEASFLTARCRLASDSQVVWRGAVGDRHLGRAALPGHVQRASAAFRHGGRTPG